MSPDTLQSVTHTDVVRCVQGDFTPVDAAQDTIDGKFQGPSQEAAATVQQLIKDAVANPTKYGRQMDAASLPVDDSLADLHKVQQKKRRRRIKKRGDMAPPEQKRNEL